MKTNTKQIIAKAVVTVLKPLLRVLMQNEVSHAEFSDLAKRAYIEVAHQHFSIPKRKMTYARLAVLTGMNRKEVVRLSKLIAEEQPKMNATPNRAVRVLNGWMSDPEFTNNDGEPMQLPLQGETGSFAALVARYSGDISLGAVIDEFERIGVASRIQKDTVQLTSDGYIPSDDQLEKIRIMSVCAADLLSTAVHNLAQDTELARFQRQLDYQEVPASVVEEFELYSREKSTALIQELNQFLSTRIRQARPSNDETKRVGMGMYYFVDNTNEGK